MRRWKLGLVLLVATVAGCGHPFIPASTLHRSRAAQVGPPVTGRPLLGVDLYAQSDYPLPRARKYGARNLAYVHDTLGAQAVGIAWNFYSPGNHSNQVERNKITLSPEAVTALTREAYTNHMVVEYRPLIRVGPKWGWEGFIYPTDPQAWFNALYQAELPYLQIAQRLKVREFVVSTELQTLSSSYLWRQFLARVAHVYHGIVSYAAAEYDYYNSATHPVLPIRLLGMDSYPHINLPPTATVRQLVAGWSHRFSGVSKSELARTAIDEIGIQAARDAYHAPEAWNTNEGPLDEQVQARWFTAACRFVARSHMRGIYFWNVNLAGNPARPPYPSPSTFEGKKGALAIHGCLHILAQE